MYSACTLNNSDFRISQDNKIAQTVECTSAR